MTKRGAKETTAYLGLGTNLGDRWGNLRSAVQLLETPNRGVRVIRASRVYETEPWGLGGQPKFLNCVVEAATSLAPLPLLRRVKEVEAALGRTPGPRYGPRVADVDILLYGNLVVEEPGDDQGEGPESEPELQVPHPRLHLRAFALAPLAELAPAYVHPVLGRTIEQLAEAADGLAGVIALGPLAGPQA